MSAATGPVDAGIHPDRARDARSVLLPGFAGLELPDWLARRLRDGLAGVCLFGENIRSAGQTRALTDAIRAANPHAIIAIDEEGGDVTRLYYDVGSPFPGNAILGRVDDEGFTERVARRVGGELRSVGVNLDLAPDADVNSNPDNPVIGVRSFGADPVLVARHTAAWVRGLEATGVASCAKHFPGHGDTALDSHLALPVVDASLEVLLERELVPFRAAVAAGARAVMTSHIVLPQLDPRDPATFSRRILTGLLRDELGFEGVIVTDALDMAGASGDIGIAAAAVRAIDAGADLLCIGTRNTDAQLDELERALAAADPARLADASRRVRALGEQLARSVPGGGAGSAPYSVTGSGRDSVRDSVTDSVPGSVLGGGLDAGSGGADVARIADAIEVRPGLRIEPGSVLVALQTEPNAAIGTVPWGVEAAGAAVIRLGEGQEPPSDEPLVLLGRDNHRHAWVRELVDRLRATRPETVVVDLGWPSPDRAYADIATFGASGAVGAALLARLGLAEPDSELPGDAEPDAQLLGDAERGAAGIHSTRGTTP